MTRTCTVCQHPDRAEIDKALIAATDPYRHIAPRYGLTPRSLLRHKADHVTADILAAWQRERADNGAELASELRGWMDRLTMLFDACHDWLLDPDDATRYDLGPRAHEVMCHYEIIDNSGKKPFVIRRKDTLATLLARVDGHSSVGFITVTEYKTADPRELILKTNKELQGNLRLIGELVGKLQTQGTINFIASPEWVALRTRMLAALALYPDARLALAAAIEGEAEEVGA